MASGDDGKTNESSSNNKKPADPLKRSSGTNTTRTSAVKKPVTIDLEAKDVTDKTEKRPQKKSTAASETGDASKSDVKASVTKPTPSQTASSNTQKKEAPSQDKPQNAGKQTGEALKEKTEAKPQAARAAKPPKKELDKPPAKPVSASQKSGSAWGSIFTAFIGGIIALGIWFVLQKMAIIEGGDQAKIAELTSRIEALETAPALEAVSQNQFTTITDRLDEIEQGIVSNDPVISDDITTRLAALEARIAEAGNSGDGTSLDEAAPSDLLERLSAIETRINEQASFAGSSDFGSLEERIAALELLRRRAASDESAKRLDDNELIAATQQAVTSAIELDFSSLQTQVKQTEEAQQETMGRLEEGLQNLTQLEETIASHSDVLETGRAALQLLALERLKENVVAGHSYATVLALLEQTGVDNTSLETLRTHSESTPKNKIQLQAELDDLILQAAAKQGQESAPDEELSAFEKLASC